MNSCKEFFEQDHDYSDRETIEAILSLKEGYHPQTSCVGGAAAGHVPTLGNARLFFLDHSAGQRMGPFSKAQIRCMYCRGLLSDEFTVTDRRQRYSAPIAKFARLAAKKYQYPVGLDRSNSILLSKRHAWWFATGAIALVGLVSATHLFV